MFSKILSTNPAIFISLITAAITLGLSYGYISQAHADALVSFVGAAVPPLLVLLSGVVTRQAVYSPSTVQKIADNAAATGSTDIGTPSKGDTAPAQP